MTEYLLTPAQQHVLLTLTRHPATGASPTDIEHQLRRWKHPMSMSNVYSVLARLRALNLAIDTWYRQGNRRRVRWSPTEAGIQALRRSIKIDELVTRVGEIERKGSSDGSM